MKPPLLPLAILCLSASLALAAPHGASHAGSSGTHHHKKSHHSARVSIPHQRRHVTYQEKKTLLDRAGIPKSRWHDYIVDHRVPLELGGSNDLSNLQLMDKVSAKRKDRVENYLAAKVRHGTISLAQARSQMLHWENLDTAH